MAGKHYSIIIVPDDHSGTRQYRVSQRLLLGAGIVAALFLVTITTFLITYSKVLGDARMLPSVREENKSLREQIVVLNELNRELEDLSALRAQIVALLGHGVDGDELGLEPPRSPEDENPMLSLQPEALDHLAAVALVKRYTPSGWPLGGDVEREFFTQTGEKTKEPHPGLDIEPRWPEEPVAAAGAGRVEEVGHDGSHGDFVRIAHGFGVESYYADLGRIVVENGQMVERGQALAYLGSPSDGERRPLYFEIRVDGRSVDPRRYLDAR